MSENIIETDVVIIGAGPVGLFAVFELGLLDLKCQLIDILDRPGGQCTELYPEKPIYDIPGYPVITGQELIDNLMKQIEPFGAEFHFSRMVTRLEKQADGSFVVRTDADDVFRCKVVVVAAGGGSFQPKRPPIDGIEAYEGSSVFYSVRRMEDFRVRTSSSSAAAIPPSTGRSISAPLAQSLTLVHRRDEFRAAPAYGQRDARAGCRRPDEPRHRPGRRDRGRGRRPVRRSTQDRRRASISVPATRMLPFFGLTMKLGPVADWGHRTQRQPDLRRHGAL